MAAWLRYRRSGSGQQLRFNLRMIVENDVQQELWTWMWPL